MYNTSWLDKCDKIYLFIYLFNFWFFDLNKKGVFNFKTIDLFINLFIFLIWIKK